MVSDGQIRYCSSTSFADWLAKRWSSERFVHSYALREKGRSTGKKSQIWSIGNLREAKEGYKWNGKSLQENEGEVGGLRERLLGAVTKRNNSDALKASFEVLKWGKVFTPTKNGERASVQWLKNAFAEGTLCSKLSDSVEVLKRGDFNRYDGVDLMMNSGITKIVSLADPEDRLIIYDGRVGAALGYLIRIFLTEKNASEVPTDLLFGWGGAKTKGVNRNPSTQRYRFPGLWQGTNKDREHARMMSSASHLIDSIRRQTAPQTSSREWEAALFMVGYEIPMEEQSEA